MTDFTFEEGLICKIAANLAGSMIIANAQELIKSPRAAPTYNVARDSVMLARDIIRESIKSNQVHPLINDYRT